MIPHSLQLKNFLSYGSEMQMIDFRPHHLIYLSGKNGHGKSALLDAMTWALWGQARKTTNAVKPDFGLLRLGATHMIVIFDFELEGQRYRVKREFMQTKSKQGAYLEFGMIDEKDRLIPLTDKTIRATQAVIERTIRLDYESFINSAFLRQGHANEFSQKSPKDRKEILSTILGLQQFDQLKKRALERVKQAMNQRDALRAVQESLMQQCSKADDIQEKKKVLDNQVIIIKHDEKRLTLEQKNFDHASVTYRDRQKEYELLRFQSEQTSQVYQDQLQTMQKKWKRWRMIQAMQQDMPDYKQLEKDKTQVSVMIQHYHEMLQKRISLQTVMIACTGERQVRQRQLEHTYAQETQKITMELERLVFEKESVIKNKSAAEQIKKDLHKQKAIYQNEHKLCAMQSIDEKRHAAMFAQFEKRKDRYQQWQTKNNWLKTEHENLMHKKKVVDSNNPSCPLCDQNLSAARRKFLGNQFIKQERLVSHQYNRLHLISTRLKALLIEQHQNLEANQKLLIKKESIEKEMHVIDEKIIEHDAHLAALQTNLEKINGMIKEQEKIVMKQQKIAVLGIEQDLLYKEKKTTIERIEKDLAAIAYNEKEHRALQERYALLERKIADLVDLKHELFTQAQRAQEIHVLVHTLKKQKKEISSNEHLQNQYGLLEKQKMILAVHKREIDEQLHQLQEKKEKAREEHGRLKMQQEHDTRIEKEYKKQQDTIEKLNHEIKDYQIIANAAGKDGVQALLIEQVLPEIEQEANYLLSKLTNNQSHIFIESLRDLKRGGSKETLDINISDPSGIRPYEMFSGGEAFRIDFSLRIALSKLLARRAGSSLQLLIIDEGFGSQDEEGLSLIMDAIYKVHHDFEKVIVVSHLPAMRDQFPVHFIVQKGVNGTALSVVENG